VASYKPGYTRHLTYTQCIVHKTRKYSGTTMKESQMTGNSENGYEHQCSILNKPSPPDIIPCHYGLEKRDRTHRHIHPQITFGTYCPPLPSHPVPPWPVLQFCPLEGIYPPNESETFVLIAVGVENMSDSHWLLSAWWDRRGINMTITLYAV
jgi:hypothetical protein